MNPPAPAGSFGRVGNELQHQNPWLFQIVLHHLKRNWNPQGWQQEMQPTERANIIIQIVTSLRLVRTDVEQTQAILIATEFERSTYKKSQNRVGWMFFSSLFFSLIPMCLLPLCSPQDEYR
ncbi:hypothetical protein B9Z19DRAFT_1027825, partial [Tuber borchii]